MANGHSQAQQPKSQDNVWFFVIAAITLQGLTGAWLAAISGEVLQPYLDEVFHITQAQEYCANRFHIWDPKITTPPGLYLLSYCVLRVTGYCNIPSLRALNVFLLFGIFLVALRSQSRALKRPTKQSLTASSVFSVLDHSSAQHIHSALNVCLFPPLFFFSAMYYTDVGSTLFVLLFFQHFTATHASGTPSILQSIMSIALGVASLFFRQTNVFWVAVFPAGLLLFGDLGTTRNLKENKLDLSNASLRHIGTVADRSWQDEVMYDPMVRGTSFEAYVLCVVSTVTRLLRSLQDPRKLFRIVRLLAPYVTILAFFGGFVLWNGGVVLGDKSNHVATLHLPQMLYIWPYITFFSIPLTYPFFVRDALGFLATIPYIASVEPMLMFLRQKTLPRLAVALVFIGVASYVVKVNTIVHPFTLADNRHFTFYVFRLLLLRHPAIKFIAVPLYFICAWTVLQALGSPARSFFTSGVEKKEKRDSKPSPPREQLLSLNEASVGEGCTVSFVIVWLITSALQLITAPLVEPRYFILPWLMWRLRVPLAHPDNDRAASNKQREAGSPASEKWLNTVSRLVWHEHDHRLWLETIWFVAINAATIYIFLNWGFSWPQEPGSVQRFMW